MRRTGAWPAALGLLLLYVALAGGHTYSIDGFLMFEQARSLALHDSLHFGEPVRWAGVYTTSKYGVGQSLLYAPFVWLLTRAGVHPTYAPGRHLDLLYVWIGPWLQAASVAASAALVLQLVRAAGGSARAAWWGFALFGLASPALIYARGDWAQPLSGLCWIASLYAAVRLRQRLSAGMLVALGAAVLFGILTRLVDGAFAVAAAAVLVLDRRRALAVLMLAAGAGVALTALVDWARFGSALATGYPATWTTPIATGVLGSVLSPSRGLLWAFPLVTLAPIGFARLWRSGSRALGLALGLSCVLELVSTATWQYWWGGYDWELRLFVPALPALAVLGAMAIDAVPRPVPLTALVLGLAAAVPAVIVDMNQGYARFADGTAASWQLGAYPLFGAVRFFHRSGVDLFWWRAAHTNRELLAVPLLLALAGLALIASNASTSRSSRPTADV